MSLNDATSPLNPVPAGPSRGACILTDQNMATEGDDHEVDTSFTLRDALFYVAQHGFGVLVDADSLIERAAQGLVALYDSHGLENISCDSAADQCESLYALLCSVGLDVA